MTENKFSFSDRAFIAILAVILILIFITAFTSCSPKYQAMTSKVVELKVDDLRRSKSYVVLSNSDTLFCVDKGDILKVDSTYTFMYLNGFRKNLKSFNPKNN